MKGALPDVRYRTRIALLALSGLIGWTLGQLVTLPANLLIAVRDSEGQVRLFLQTIAYGLAVWGAWTLLLATAALLMVGLPLVLAIPPRVLVRFRVLTMVITAVAALAATLHQLQSFRDPTAPSVLKQFAQALPYGIFAVVFAVGTAWAYTWLMTRRLGSRVAQG